MTHPCIIGVRNSRVLLAQMERVGRECRIRVDRFFEQQAGDFEDAASRQTGRVVGRTRLGNLRNMYVELSTTSGLWPSKKATHKGPCVQLCGCQLTPSRY